MTTLNQTFEYVELALDSWDSTTGGGTYFENSTSAVNQIQYSWPQYYFTRDNYTVAGMKVISAEIPFVFDTVTSANNTFVINISGTPTTITIPVGTYTGTSLAAQLQVLLAAVSAGFVVTWSATTLRFTFTMSAAVSWSLNFSSRRTAYSLLGFLPDSITSATGAGSSIVSPTAATPTGPYYLYLNSRAIGSLVAFKLPDGAAPASGPELCRLPINANFGEVIFYNDPDPEKYFDFFVGQQLGNFDLYLTLGSDQYQKPLDMKGVAWSVKLGLLVYRDASPTVAKRPASMMKGENTFIQ